VSALRLARCCALAAILLAATGASAQMAEGMRTVATRHSFDTLLERVERAVERNGLGVVAMASASRGAASRGVKIPGNAVVMVFRNDIAVQLLSASVAAGYEAPLRIYVTEGADGHAMLSYRLPSAVFAPYRNAKVDSLARQLDATLAKIVNDAGGG
jgi:uncharacterized protein (DUF302 family)